ncbi:MAG: ferritin-like domain-containing protein [Planctomycetota bacterium]|jgi:rubrerythrin
MVVEFNAFEIFEIAEKIERNGTEFYRKAAGLFEDSRVRNMFLQLTEWEKAHEQVFANMRKELSAQGPEMRTFKPENDVVFDAQSMAGLAVFGNKMDPSAELTGKESITDILKCAIEKEKDTIIFYTGLKDFVSAEAGKDKIADIIKEEMHHVRILEESLQWQ